MPQILIRREAKQPPTAAETRGELEIGEVGVAVRIKPVLFLGEIIVGDAGAMQRAQGRFGRGNSRVAVRPGHV